MSLPVVDLAQAESEACDNIRQILAEHGFFYLVGHGIEPGLLAAALDAMRQFFELPQEDKAASYDLHGEELDMGCSTKWGGYLPWHSSKLDPLNQSQPDQKESWSMTRELSGDHPEVQAWPALHGPNSWPSPALLPEFQRTMSAYFAAVSALGPRVLRLVARACDLQLEYFAAEGMFDRPTVTLGANHYSATESKPQEGVLGIGAHTDYGALTFLYTDDVPGLEIAGPDHGTHATSIGLRDEGSVAANWIPVPPLAGAFIVNVGDMLERLSNSRLPSTLHRVVNRSGRERFSLALFFEPNADCPIEALESCCSEEQPCKYEKVDRYGDWLLAKFEATGGG